MSHKHLFWVSLIILGMYSSSWARTQRTSLCSLQDSPEKFLNSKVEVEASVFAGVEYPRITDGECSFRFAYGDDYQTFGGRFPATRNDQWKLLKKLLSETECASNVRVAKAKIQGTVVRVPATGTVPPKEMPFELIIQSVSDVSRVPVKCTPRAAYVPRGGSRISSSGPWYWYDAKRFHYAAFARMRRAQVSPVVTLLRQRTGRRIWNGLLQGQVQRFEHGTVHDAGFNAKQRASQQSADLEPIFVRTKQSPIDC